MKQDLAQKIVAVLGLGSIGLRHAGNLRGLGQRVIGYDPDPARCALWSEQGCETLSSAEAALQVADAVVVASPSACHLDDMSRAVAAGCHIYIEKPLAHTDAGLSDLLDEADRMGLVVFAGMNLRFNPAVRHAAELLREGRLGLPLWGRFLSSSYLPDWRAGQDYRTGYAADPLTGGVIFDVVHEFDLANYLLGPGKTQVACAGRTGQLDMASEDWADIVLAHDNNVRSSLHLDYVTRPRRRQAEIAGSEGLLEIDVARRQLRLFDVEDRVVLKRGWKPDPAKDYRNAMAQFLRCMDGREAPACNGREALAVLRQVLQARRLSGLPEAETKSVVNAS